MEPVLTQLVAKNSATSQVKVDPITYNNCTEPGFSVRLTSIRPVPKMLAWQTSVLVTHLQKQHFKFA